MLAARLSSVPNARRGQIVAGEPSSVIRVRPMLLTAVDRVDDREGFQHELKIDGFRAVALGEARRLTSRQGRDLTRRFPELADVLERFARRRAIVDGEIAAFVDGVPDFAALQGRRTPVVYVAFDVLAMDGKDTMALPLRERRVLLEDLVGADSQRLIRSRAFPSAKALFAEAERRGLEGIVSKDDSSPYIVGPSRTRYWLKTKTSHGIREERIRQETWGHGRKS